MTIGICALGTVAYDLENAMETAVQFFAGQDKENLKPTFADDTVLTIGLG